MLPNAVTVPAGHQEITTLRAVGSMNYECRTRAGMSGAFGWVLDAPDASLRHWSGLTMGRLYAGPTWLYRDGSKVIAKLVGTSPGGAGKLPKRACTSALIGRGERVPFSAEYAFFKKE
jgi:hypothetical protein